MYNMCSCKCGDYCPLGKRGSEIRCTADELRDKLRELIPTKEVNLSDWKNATCETCRFRVENDCRRFPPTTASYATGIDSSEEYTTYPTVSFENITFHPACAEYQTEGEKTSQVVRDACKVLFDTGIPASGVANDIFEDYIENHRAKRDATGWDVPPIRELK